MLNAAVAAAGASGSTLRAVNAHAVGSWKIAVAPAAGLLALLLLHAGAQLAAQARALTIHQLQGAGVRSPFESALVTIGGVVTGRKSNGFFIQSPEGTADGNPATSEGLFVFTSSAPPANVTSGTLVTVSGRVLEFVPAADPTSPPLTEVTDVSAIDVRGAGMTLPAAVDLQAADRTFAAGGPDPLERLEGMRVRVVELVLASGTLGTVNEANATGSSNGVFYGVLPGIARPFRRPGLGPDQALPAGSPCCVPRQDGNPQRIRVDSDGQPGAAAINASAQSVVRNLVGPLDFGFRSYTILPDPATPPQVMPAVFLATARRPADDEFTVASVNLQRFYDTSDDPGVGDVVLTPTAYQNRLRKASRYIRQLMFLPHVIGVQEAENLGALRDLAITLNREAREARELKPRYEAHLEPGSDPSGINVGFLVDRARVEVLQVEQEGAGEQFRAPNGSLELLHDRPPLVVRVRATWPTPSRPIAVVVAHMRSLIDIDHPTSGARVRLKRALQAESLARMIDRRQSIDAPEPIVVVGDLNAFEFSDGFVDVVGTVRGHPAPRDTVVQPTSDFVSPDFVNLGDTLDATERYSYVFDGVAQALDHVLVSPGLLPFVAGFAYIRGNADSPETFRSDVNRPERISDHDAALVYFRLP